MLLLIILEQTIIDFTYILPNTPFVQGESSVKFSFHITLTPFGSCIRRVILYTCLKYWKMFMENDCTEFKCMDNFVVNADGLDLFQILIHLGVNAD